MHSKIEKKKKIKRIYMLPEWMVMEETRVNPSPFKVHIMSYDDFLNFKWLAQSFVANHNIDTDGKPVRFLKVKSFKFCRQSNKILYRYNYKDDGYCGINFLKKPENNATKAPPKKVRKRKCVLKKKPATKKADTIELIEFSAESLFFSFYTNQLSPPKLYSSAQPISIAKKKDLMDLVKTGVIPQYSLTSMNP